MTKLLWTTTALLGAWLALWRREGDRWGWLGMANAWAEWGVAALGVLAVAGAAQRRWVQGGVAAALWAWGASRRGLALVPLLGATTGRDAAALPAPAEADGPTFSIFGANLYKRSRSAQPHVRLLRAYQPDIACFQELKHEFAAELVSGLSDLYPYRAWRPEPGAQGFGVLSRFPLVETGHWDAPGVEPWCQRVLCTLPDGAELEVYNVHLVPPAANSTLRIGMTWGFRAREAQLRRMQAEIAARGLPACVIGDCNFADSADAYALACEAWGDAWTAVGQGRRWTWPTRGFPWEKLPFNPRMLRLDYCFHNARLRPDAMQVLAERTGSDHCPLLVRLAVA